MIRKTLSKVYIITTFAMFGLFLQPNVFANENYTISYTDVNQYSNQYSNQYETYLIKYRHDKSGQEIVQVFDNKISYQSRLEELSNSSSHLILHENMVRNGHDDMFMSNVIVK